MLSRCTLLLVIVAVAVLTIEAAPGGSNSKAKTSDVAVQDRMIEIGLKDLKKLKKLYTPDGKKSYVAYTIISNFIRWFEQDSSLTESIKFYSLNGDFSDGTFFMMDKFIMRTDTISKSYHRLHRLLQLIDYSKERAFVEVRSAIRPTVISAIQSQNAEISGEYPSVLLKMPRQVALKHNIKVPKGITLRPITESHDLKKVFNNNPYRREALKQLLPLLAKYNLNVGTFTDDGTLVAWVFRHPSGLLGNLQEDVNYKDKGYTELVTKYIQKEVAKMGDDVYGNIEVDNVRRSLIEKLGSQVADTIFVITSKPK